jgi:hypothetical protein
MSERVAAVVGEFMRLDPQEKTAAYLDIEAEWKALRAEAEPAPDPPQPGARASNTRRPRGRRPQSRPSRSAGHRSSRPATTFP